MATVVKDRSIVEQVQTNSTYAYITAKMRVFIMLPSFPPAWKDSNLSNKPVDGNVCGKTNQMLKGSCFYKRGVQQRRKYAEVSHLASWLPSVKTSPGTVLHVKRRMGMGRWCGSLLAEPAYQSPMETVTSWSPRTPSLLPCRFIITGLFNSLPLTRRTMQPA